MRNKTILISGASIAGPATAFWLTRYGFTTTVVEQAPSLRDGGQAVDFRGEQVDVLRRMNLLEEVRRHETAMGAQHVLDSAGGRVFSLPASFFGGEVEIQRGDLSRILYHATRDETEYIFGDRVTSLTDTGQGVRVAFERGAPRTFDLVVGADGLHSGVRSLVFGPESRFRKDSGYVYAGFSMANHLGLDHVGLMYSAPGRGVMLASHRLPAEANVGLVLAAQPPGRPVDLDRRDTAALKKILADRFGGLGWEVPKIIEGMWQSDDLFCASLSQLHLDHYTRGRVALVGDAGWGAGPGGGGTGMALLAAYVLAGELAAVDGDHRVAFARYEAEVRRGAEAGLKQAKNAGRFLAPRTPKGIWLRNQIHRVLASKMLVRSLDKMAMKAANSLILKDYASPEEVSGRSAAPTKSSAAARDIAAPPAKASS
ncbi:MAG TPA: FAD-dependent monooxygenase [Amycolatopsis sp.]|jgi:2-polyprenyl-6-methoxyphenol hydroxylase-like FAD-dependent oxidoreductase|nr:FAD-dependent monooxygenase [Amycolatopsis sp.]